MSPRCPLPPEAEAGLIATWQRILEERNPDLGKITVTVVRDDEEHDETVTPPRRPE